MASCNLNRCSAYSEDVRWTLDYSSVQIASNLNVHRSTMDRILQVFQSTGSVSKKYPKEAAFKVITPACAMFILNLVTSKPAIYLHEIQAAVEESLLVDVHISTIGHFLSTSGFTWQKLRYVALQRDD